MQNREYPRSPTSPTTHAELSPGLWGLAFLEGGRIVRRVLASVSLALLGTGCALTRALFGVPALPIPPTPPHPLPTGSVWLLLSGIGCVIGAAVPFGWPLGQPKASAALGLAGGSLIVTYLIVGTYPWVLLVTYFILAALGTFLLVDYALKSRVTSALPATATALDGLSEAATAELTKAISTLPKAQAAIASKVLGLP